MPPMPELLEKTKDCQQLLFMADLLYLKGF